MPRIIPEPRYFSMPSTVVGAVALRNEARNWTPWVRSLTQDPFAWTNSPAEIIAAWPTRVIRSRWPRALTRSTQKPFSELWNVIGRPGRPRARLAWLTWLALPSPHDEQEHLETLRRSTALTCFSRAVALGV